MKKNKNDKEKESKNKCQICGYEDLASAFGEDEDTCPICGSHDIDDADYNPYEEDDDNDEWNLF